MLYPGPFSQVLQGTLRSENRCHQAGSSVEQKNRSPQMTAEQGPFPAPTAGTSWGRPYIGIAKSGLLAHPGSLLACHFTSCPSAGVLAGGYPRWEGGQASRTFRVAVPMSSESGLLIRHWPHRPNPAQEQTPSCFSVQGLGSHFTSFLKRGLMPQTGP